MTVPYGPWGFDNSGAATPMYFQDAPYFTFGAYPNQATLPNTVAGATDIAFVPLIFDNSNNTWADAMLSTGALVSSVWASYGNFAT